MVRLAKRPEREFWDIPERYISKDAMSSSWGFLYNKGMVGRAEF